MIVETKVLNRWKLLKQSGDQKRIAEKMKVSENAVSRAFVSGRSSQKIIDAINSFYKSK